MGIFIKRHDVGYILLWATVKSVCSCVRIITKKQLSQIFTEELIISNRQTRDIDPCHDSK